ncbi:unnamed protein product [Rotaria sp. Silwood1]|nr:unnamed protein product [Rotaria sp. Silwood1]CAF1430236.1 unnamed protein product [Rotaria sp. Silwood1]CAF3631782.1 unnamed protein product [Rotaria sp. Silwood1]CAF3698421.1 unnamed protein product [Rotaria sp. Silwood1]
MSSEDIDASSINDFNPNRALGFWHILATNLNMWKDKLNPTITYSIHDQLSDGRIRLNDLVEYYTRRPFVGFVPTNVQGIDTQSKYKSSRFQWRGNGLLKLFTSEFGIIFVDNETPIDQPYQWIATMFSSTLFTDAGVDLMTRTRQPPTYVLNNFVQFCQEHSIIRSISRNMFYTRENKDDTIHYIKDLQLDS